MPSAEELAGFPVLAGLGAQQRAVLAEHAETVTIAAGATIFAQGEAAERCWLLRTGRVALETAEPGGRRHVIQTLGSGDVLGWSWLVPPYRWRLDATAVTPVTAVVLDGAALRARAEQDPAFGYPLVVGLIGALLPRLHGTRARLLDLYGSPRER